MAAFLGPLIGLAMGGISSLFGKSGTNPLSGQINGVPGATSATLGNVPGAIASGNANIGKGSADLGAAGKFFQTILGGSRADTQKLLGPQTQTILDQYDNAAKTASNLGPRGGGRTEVLGEADTGKVGAYGKLLNGVLPSAASGLADVGSKESSIGLGQTGQENQVGTSALGVQQKSAEVNAGGFASLGQGLGGILATLFGKGSSGASISTPSTFPID